MKSLTLHAFFLLFSSVLMAQNAQNPEFTRLSLKNHDLKNDWRDGFHCKIGLSSTYTEGSLKKFVASPLSINIGMEFRDVNIAAVSVAIRPASLRQSFTNDGQVWSKDTSISFITFQGIFAYQFWHSKHAALYLFGGLGVHNLTAGKSCNNQNDINRPNNCDKDKAWTLISVAPSTGFFIDFRRQHEKSKNPFNSPYHYLRLKFAANPAWFQQIGQGILYDTGLVYVL
jgi:hypothetical protein